MKKLILHLIFLCFFFQSGTAFAQSSQEHLSRGLAKHAAGDFNAAIANFNQVIRNNQESSVAYFCRGRSYAELKKHQEAIDDYSKALELKPHYPNAFFRRGISYHAIGKYKEATNDFDKVSTIEPNMKKLFLKRGLSKYEMGKYREAIIDFNRELGKEDEPNIEIYYHRAMAQYAQLNFGGAIQDFDVVIEQKPHHRDAIYYRGLSYIRKGHLKEGCEDLERAEEMGEERAAIHIKNRCNLP